MLHLYQSPSIFYIIDKRFHHTVESLHFLGLTLLHTSQSQLNSSSISKRGSPYFSKSSFRVGDVILRYNHADDPLYKFQKWSGTRTSYI